MRSKLHSELGLGWYLACGFIGGMVAWYFDLSEVGIALSVFAGVIAGLFMSWMYLVTKGLEEMEEKFDDIDSRLDDIEEGD